MIKKTINKFNYLLKGESKKVTYYEKIFGTHLITKDYNREYIKYSY